MVGLLGMNFLFCHCSRCTGERKALGEFLSVIINLAIGAILIALIIVAILSIAKTESKSAGVRGDVRGETSATKAADGVTTSTEAAKSSTFSISAWVQKSPWPESPRRATAGARQSFLARSILPRVRLFQVTQDGILRHTRKVQS